MATTHEDPEVPEQHSHETAPLLDNENEQKWKPPKGFLWIEIGKPRLAPLTINERPSQVHI
jgi:hypothetical protein